MFRRTPLGSSGLEIGQRVTAQLVADGGTAGQVFPLTVEAPRPRLASALIAEPSSGPYLATNPLIVTLTSGTGVLPRQAAVRIRHVEVTPPTPCDASLPDPTSVTIAGTDVHLRTAATLAVDLGANVLGDREFGTLQMQLVNSETGTGSNWVSLAGTFVRAPVVTQIFCPSVAGEMCRLYGSNLAAIDAVKDASGAYVPPGLACPPTDKGVACVYVPNVAHYTLRLIDAATHETLPDALVVNPSH